MVKCDICGDKAENLFLGKIKGTYIQKDKKLKAVCSGCQRKLGNKLEENL